MAGEIYGIISREDAWHMWQPYEERGVAELDGTLDVGTISPAEAMRILYGANRETHIAAHRYWRNDNKGRYWMEGIKDVIAEGASEELLEIIQNSHEAQQKFAEQRRAEVAGDESEFVRQLQIGAIALQREGVFSKSQTEKIHSQLISPDGTPYVRYVPMSFLEYGRLGLKYDCKEPNLRSNDCTDLSLGILWSAVGLRPETIGRQQRNRFHESVHGSFAGTEIWDITREDGWRRPFPAVIGMFAIGPTTEIDGDDDFSRVENSEMNEGWTEYISQLLQSKLPHLAAPPKHTGAYATWAETMAQIHKQSPDLFRQITDAMLVEATPQQPTAKREAMQKMHEYADRKLGENNSLTKLFQTAGGTLPDLFTKGEGRCDATNQS